VVVATDAPLLPGQCARLAQRAGLGIARVGGVAADSSGDLFICFSTANRGRLTGSEARDVPLKTTVEMLQNAHLTSLFTAVVDATEEAILNALLAAETMTGRDDITAYALPHHRLAEVMSAYGRAPRTNG
jgi:D-aminopeptidase